MVRLTRSSTAHTPKSSQRLQDARNAAARQGRTIEQLQTQHDIIQKSIAPTHSYPLPDGHFDGVARQIEDFRKYSRPEYDKRPGWNPRRYTSAQRRVRREYAAFQKKRLASLQRNAKISERVDKKVQKLGWKISEVQRAGRVTSIQKRRLDKKFASLRKEAAPVVQYADGKSVAAFKSVSASLSAIERRMQLTKDIAFDAKLLRRSDDDVVENRLKAGMNELNDLSVKAANRMHAQHVNAAMKKKKGRASKYDRDQDKASKRWNNLDEDESLIAKLKFSAKHFEHLSEEDREELERDLNDLQAHSAEAAETIRNTVLEKNRGRYKKQLGKQFKDEAQNILATGRGNLERLHDLNRKLNSPEEISPELRLAANAIAADIEKTLRTTIRMQFGSALAVEAPEAEIDALVDEHPALKLLNARIEQLHRYAPDQAQPLRLELEEILTQEPSVSWWRRRER